MSGEDVEITGERRPLRARRSVINYNSVKIDRSLDGTNARRASRGLDDSESSGDDGIDGEEASIDLLQDKHTHTSTHSSKKIDLASTSDEADEPLYAPVRRSRKPQSDHVASSNAHPSSSSSSSDSSESSFDSPRQAPRRGRGRGRGRGRPPGSRNGTRGGRGGTAARGGGRGRGRGRGRRTNIFARVQATQSESSDESSELSDSSMADAIDNDAAEGGVNNSGRPRRRSSHQSLSENALFRKQLQLANLKSLASYKEKSVPRRKQQPREEGEEEEEEDEEDDSSEEEPLTADQELQWEQYQDREPERLLAMRDHPDQAEQQRQLKEAKAASAAEAAKKSTAVPMDVDDTNPAATAAESTEVVSASKPAEATKESDDAEEEEEEVTIYQFLVKFVGMGYKHCVWLDEAVIEQWERGYDMIGRFLRSKEKGKFDENEWAEGIFFPSSYLQVERIIARQGPDMTESQAKAASVPSRRKKDREEKDRQEAAAAAEHAAGQGKDPDNANDSLADADMSEEKKETEDIVDISASEPAFASTPAASSSSSLRLSSRTRNPDGSSRSPPPYNDTSRYLVKWKDLDYTEATWETRADIDDDEAIEAYWHRATVLKRRLKPKQRGPVDKLPPDLLPIVEKQVKSLPYSNENFELRPYQVEGVTWMAFNWLQKRTGQILADEMGLGKTIQAASFLHWMSTAYRVSGPFLIVAPLSTIAHWQREFQLTGLNAIVWDGGEGNRAQVRQYEFNTFEVDGQPKKLLNHHAFDVLITSYGSVLSETNVLRSIQWAVVCVDEAQRSKNIHSRLTNILQGSLKYDHALLLTGTPIQNNVEELWSLLHTIAPKEFASFGSFHEKYGELTSANQISDLHSSLRPYLLRRLKEDVEKSLPPRSEIVVEVDLSPLQKQFYRAIYEENAGFLLQLAAGRNEGEKNRLKQSQTPSLMNVCMQLRHVCNHPFLIKSNENVELSRVAQMKSEWKKQGKRTDGQDFQREIMLQLIQASGKFILLSKLLPRLKEDGHRCLIFSQFKKCLDMLEDFLEFLGMKYERLDGNITGNERQAAIDRYCAKDSDRFAFLLSTKAGGVGINLAAADTVIIIDSDWNPQSDLQAMARVHRIGQVRKVQMYRLITRGTYEETLFEKSSMKLGLDHALLHSYTNSSKDGALARMTKSDIEMMLKKGAYHVFLDNTKSTQLNEDSIDVILKRDTHVVTYQGSTVISDDKKAEGEGGAAPDNAGTTSTAPSSSFAKASFVLNSDTGETLDLHATDFWQKIGLKEEAAKELPRQRARKAVDYSQEHVFSLDDSPRGYSRNGKSGSSDDDGGASDSDESVRRSDVDTSASDDQSSDEDNRPHNRVAKDGEKVDRSAGKAGRKRFKRMLPHKYDISPLLAKRLIQALECAGYGHWATMRALVERRITSRHDVACLARMSNEALRYFSLSAIKQALLLDPVVDAATAASRNTTSSTNLSGGTNTAATAGTSSSSSAPVLLRKQTMQMQFMSFLPLLRGAETMAGLYRGTTAEERVQRSESVKRQESVNLIAANAALQKQKSIEKLADTSAPATNSAETQPSASSSSVSPSHPSSSASISPISPDLLKMINLFSCVNCGNSSSSQSKCGACHTVVYCSRECQRSHWPRHKAECAIRSADPRIKQAAMQAAAVLAASKKQEEIASEHKETSSLPVATNEGKDNKLAEQKEASPLPKVDSTSVSSSSRCPKGCVKPASGEDIPCEILGLTTHKHPRYLVHWQGFSRDIDHDDVTVQERRPFDDTWPEIVAEFKKKEDVKQLSEATKDDLKNENVEFEKSSSSAPDVEMAAVVPEKKRTEVIDLARESPAPVPEPASSADPALQHPVPILPAGQAFCMQLCETEQYVPRSALIEPSHFTQILSDIPVDPVLTVSHVMRGLRRPTFLPALERQFILGQFVTQTPDHQWTILLPVRAVKQLQKPFRELPWWNVPASCVLAGVQPTTEQLEESVQHDSELLLATQLIGIQDRDASEVAQFFEASPVLGLHRIIGKAVMITRYVPDPNWVPPANEPSEGSPPMISMEVPDIIRAPSEDVLRDRLKHITKVLSTFTDGFLPRGHMPPLQQSHMLRAREQLKVSHNQLLQDREDWSNTNDRDSAQYFDYVQYTRQRKEINHLLQHIKEEEERAMQEKVEAERAAKHARQQQARQAAAERARVEKAAARDVLRATQEAAGKAEAIAKQRALAEMEQLARQVSASRQQQAAIVRHQEASRKQALEIQRIAHNQHASAMQSAAITAQIQMEAMRYQQQARDQQMQQAQRMTMEAQMIAERQKAEIAARRAEAQREEAELMRELEAQLAAQKQLASQKAEVLRRKKQLLEEENRREAAEIAREMAELEALERNKGAKKGSNASALSSADKKQQKVRKAPPSDEENDSDVQEVFKAPISGNKSAAASSSLSSSSAQKPSAKKLKSADATTASEASSASKKRNRANETSDNDEDSLAEPASDKKKQKRSTTSNGSSVDVDVSKQQLEEQLVARLQRRREMEARDAERDKNCKYCSRSFRDFYSKTLHERSICPQRPQDDEQPAANTTAMTSSPPSGLSSPNHGPRTLRNDFPDAIESKQQLEDQKSAQKSSSSSSSQQRTPLRSPLRSGKKI